MNTIVDRINENDIHIGDLVFIYHHEKPTKSGWWRKVSDDKYKETYYALEKPMNKNFDFKKESKNCHTENGLCVMKKNTLSFGINKKKEYEIMAKITGLDSVAFVQNNYSLDNEISFYNENTIITDRFIELLKMYQMMIVQNDDLKELAKNLI